MDTMRLKQKLLLYLHHYHPWAYILVLLNEYGGGQKIDWINIGRGRPRADVMNQLQTVILGL